MTTFSISKISLCLGLVISIAAVSSIAWGAASYLQVRPVLLKEFNAQIMRIDANEDWRQLERYKYLIIKQQNGGLTLEEQRELCILSHLLGFQTPGCN